MSYVGGGTNQTGTGALGGLFWATCCGWLVAVVEVLAGDHRREGVTL